MVQTLQNLRWLGTLMAWLVANQLMAQANFIVRGVVTSDAGEVLPGVSIVQKGATRGTTSNADGTFSISLPDGNATITVSFIGYISQDIVIGSRNELTIRLVTDVKSLNEVVVVGYTTQSRAKTTASVSKLDQRELKNVPNVNPVQALQGKIAGVSIPVLSGQPGVGANIIIRGGTKLNPYGTGTGGSSVAPIITQDNTSPLVVVDGVFRTLSDINPDDIESLQVMKDAASTAIYGARGANGVIVIKTKSGRFGGGKGNVTFRYQHGIETQARKYDYLNAREYLQLARTTIARVPQGTDAINVNTYLYGGGFSASTPTYTQPGVYAANIFGTAAYLDNIVAVEGQPYVDNLLTNLGYETMDDPVNPGKKIIFLDNHYQDRAWNTAHTNNYNIGFDGGTERTAYNVSLGYVDQGGVFAGTNYKRFSGLANLNFKVNDRLRIDVNTNYQWNDNKYLANSAFTLTRGARITPLIRYFYDDGSPAIGENTSVVNRFFELAYEDRRVNTERFTFRVGGDYEIVKNLHYRPSVSLLIEDLRHLFFRKSFPGPIQFPNPREKYNDVRQSKQVMTDHLLQYDAPLGGKHTLTALAGFNFTRNVLFDSQISSSRATSDYVYTIAEPIVRVENGQTQANYFGQSSVLNETRSASYFGQLAYDFDGRYLLGASLRYDGFSNFAPSNKYALFPSASVGWNIHREGFWKVAPVNQLKLRASYGSAGLNDLNLTDTYGNYVASQYAQNPGIIRANLANPNLRWEQTETVDVGVDLGLFNRLTLSVDYYNRLTKNRLATFGLPAESGFSGIIYNVGQLRNRGIEVELGGTVLRKGDFSWNANFSFAFNRTTVVKLPDNGREKNRQGGASIYNPATGKEEFMGGYAEGERPLGLWAFKSDGIFATDEEAKAWDVLDLVAPAATQGLGKKRGGDVRWADLNGDKKIDGRDMVFIGYRNPDKIGGLQNTFRYKALSLRVTMDYALGHMISNGALARSMGQARSGNEGAPREALGDNVWQKQGDVGKTYPRFSFADAGVGQRNHVRFATNVNYTDVGVDDIYGTDVDFYYSKGDFLAFREVSLTYEVPAGLVKRISSGGLTLNAGVYNLGYLTKYKGLNPETYKGYDEGAYPRPRQFTLGATLRF